MRLLLSILLILINFYDGYSQKSNYIDSVLNAIKQGNYTLTDFSMKSKPEPNAGRGSITKLMAISRYSSQDSSLMFFSDSSRFVYSGNRGSVFPDNGEFDTLQRWGMLNGSLLNNSLITIKHDTAANAVRNLTYRWENNQWRLTDSVTLIKNGVYDTVRVYNSDINGNIVPKVRWIYLIDTINKMYFECPASYENNDWKNSYLEFSALNSTNQPIIFIRLQSYQNNPLDSSGIIQFAYNTQNLIDRVTSITFDTLGNRSSIITTDYFYDVNNEYTGNLSSITQNGNTSYLSKEQVTTDSTGLNKKFENYTFAINTWNLENYTFYVKDTVYRIDTITYYEKNVFNPMPGIVQFNISGRQIRGYDIKGRMTQRIIQNGKTLKNTDWISTTYSNTDKILEERHYLWNSQIWTPNSVEKNTYNSEELLTNNIIGSYSNSSSSWTETKYYYDLENVNTVKELSPSYSLSLYPNPANSFVLISLEEYTPYGLLTMFDLTGKKVYSQSLLSEATIDVSNYANGVYFVRVESQGKLIGVSKLIKE